MVTPQQLREARKELRLTQPELAQRCGVDVSTIWRWENGEIPDRGSARALILQIVREAQGLRTGRAA